MNYKTIVFTLCRQFRIAAFVFLAMACDNDDPTPSLRPAIDYATLTASTPYPDPFLDAEGNPTVDLARGRDRLKMNIAMIGHMENAIAAGTVIDVNVLQRMFSNQNAPFYNGTFRGFLIDGNELNNSPSRLRNTVALSLEEADAEVARERIEFEFIGIASSSNSAEATASRGNAGKLGPYLLNPQGIEPLAVIETSLIGAYQHDYISNVLLPRISGADNSKVVDGERYTEREHLWDEAFATITPNNIYAQDPANEYGLGRINAAAHAQIYQAFLKGRAAIVNNDHDQVDVYVLLLRQHFEASLAQTAIATLNRWKTEPTAAGKAHAVSEAIGWIYSLRFCPINFADAAFADKIEEDFINTADGSWDMTTAKVDAAIAAIRTRFDL